MHEDFLEGALNITSHGRSIRLGQLLELMETIEYLNRKLNAGRAEFPCLERALLRSGFKLHVHNNN